MDSLLKEMWWVDLQDLEIVKFTVPSLGLPDLGYLYYSREEAVEKLKNHINQEIDRFSEAQERLFNV